LSGERARAARRALVGDAQWRKEQKMNTIARNCWMHMLARTSSAASQITRAMMLCALAYAGSVPSSDE
jgi:hypothetical protein